MEKKRVPPPAVAAAALVCATLWIILLAGGVYGGRLSGLFYTGTGVRLPDELDGVTYRVPDRAGYDGQFYRLVAHDPLLRQGYAAFVDNPRLRWRRIGVPGLAAILSFGNDPLVDLAYVAIELAFTFLGAFWLARYAEAHGRHPLWGLAFLAVPAVMVSLDRMTTDLPLAALCVGLLYYGAGWPAYLILAAAPLVRETGLVLIAAWCAYAVFRRDARAAAWGALCALPALGWWAFVQAHTPPDSTPWLAWYPFSGLVERTFHGAHAPLFTTWLRMAAAFEMVALAGTWLALALAAWLIWKRRWGLAEALAMAFLVLAAALGKADIWESAYAIGRTLSPLLIFLGLIALRDRRPVFALPLLLLLPRLALQYEAQAAAALRALAR